MEKSNNQNSNKFIFQSSNNENYSKKYFSKISYDLGDHKYKKNKSKDKSVKSLLNFITTKNRIIFKSYFDCKGSKKFLAEKSKALEECVLIDEIQDEDDHNLHKKKKRHSKSSHKKNKIKKKYSHYPSENHLVRYSHIGSNKKKNKLFEINNDNNKKSSKSVPKNFIKDIKDIGKISEKNSVKKSSEKENSNKSKYSVINANEPSYLMTGNNDSFIRAIVNYLDTYTL